MAPSSSWLQTLQTLRTQRLETLLQNETFLMGLSVAGTVILIIIGIMLSIIIWYHVASWLYPDDYAAWMTDTTPRRPKSSWGQVKCPGRRMSTPRRSGPRSRSGSTTPLTGQRVPPGDKSILAVPFTREAKVEPSSQLKLQVQNQEGKGLLHVEVTRASTDAAEGNAWTPEEYVTLHSMDRQEELAVCALGPGRGGGPWECHIFQREDELFGIIVEDESLPLGAPGGEVKFKLMSPARETLLVVQCRPGDRATEVFEQGKRVATLEPSDFPFCVPVEYSKVTCFSESDVGLVVLSLLGVDRLWSRRRGAQ